MGTINPGDRVTEATNPTAGGSEVALGSAEIICEDQGVTDASVPGQDDQGVCANAPHSFGKQDARDFGIKIESVKEEPVCLCVASSAASTETSGPKQDSETVEESLDRNLIFGRVCCGHKVSWLKSARTMECAHRNQVLCEPLRSF